MIPPEGSVHTREWLAVCLATVAGYVDAYGFLTFKTFVSFMSGNTTKAGFTLGEGGYAAAVPAALAIVTFVIGVFAGTLLTYSRTRYSRRLLFISAAALLTLCIVIARHTSIISNFGIVILSFTMGMMNTALSRVGTQLVNLTFVTGTLSQVGSHLAHAVRRAPLEHAQGTWDTHLRRALLLTAVWLGFLTGAILGGAATSRFGVWVLMLPLVIMLTLAALSPARSADA